jgi:hypothetical protein
MSNENKKIKLDEEENAEKHFQVLELSDCDVPVGCPFGIDPTEDVFPDHHQVNFLTCVITPEIPPKLP